MFTEKIIHIICKYLTNDLECLELFESFNVNALNYKFKKETSPTLVGWKAFNTAKINVKLLPDNLEYLFCQKGTILNVQKIFTEKPNVKRIIVDYKPHLKIYTNKGYEVTQTHSTNWRNKTIHDSAMLQDSVSGIISTIIPYKNPTVRKVIDTFFKYYRFIIKMYR